MSGNGNGNGKPTQFSISTLIQSRWQGGDLVHVISQLLESKPTGKLLIHVAQGGINTVEWTESAVQKSKS